MTAGTVTDILRLMASCGCPLARAALALDVPGMRARTLHFHPPASCPAIRATFAVAAPGQPAARAR